MAVLEVRNLCISARDEAGRPVPVVEDVSFAVPPGQVLALIGESGSGKTTVALSALGYTRPGLEVTGGSVHLDGRSVLDMDAGALRRLRGADVCYVAQSAAAAFDPVMRLMDQIVESAVLHGRMTRPEAERRAVGLFRVVGLPDPESIGRRYPHEFSGGQLQRLMLVMALCPRPRLLLLDEPTTALDVTTQISVLRSIRDAIESEGTAAIYVSHDLAVVSQVADEILVLYRGRMRESGPTRRIVAAPRDAYTRRLIDAIATPGAGDAPAPATPQPEPLLRVRDLEIRHGLRRVVHGVDLEVAPAEIVALIGESGSGKTTIARSVAGIHPRSDGEVRLDGRLLDPDLRRRTREDLRVIQYVPQMADTALNPRQSIGAILRRPVQFFGRATGGAAAQDRVRRLIERTHLDASFLDRFPQELSGGQKQRANLARALAAEPRLLLCDEVTSALDTIVARKIIDLLRELRDQTGVSILFISHDIVTVSRIADRIVVLYAGRVVEAGTVAQVLRPPFHPYTRLLILSTPELRPNWLDEVSRSRAVQVNRNTVLRAQAQSCPFFNRCPLAVPGLCDAAEPPARALDAGHVIHCHLPVDTMARASYD